jgi:hypothetical protein
MRRFLYGFLGTIVAGILVVGIASLIKPNLDGVTAGQGIGALALLIGAVAATTSKKVDKDTINKDNNT